MPFNNTAKHIMLDELASVITHMSLHTALPNASGSNEVTGGSPAYARQAVGFAASASGEKTLDGNYSFDVPASTISYIGFWNNVSAGTFYGSGALTPEVFAGQGIYTVTAATKLDLNDPA
jgi:hypothetical protein